MVFSERQIPAPKFSKKKRPIFRQDILYHPNRQPSSNVIVSGTEDEDTRVLFLSLKLGGGLPLVCHWIF